MKEVLETEGKVSEVGLKKALHICRGHFKTYTGKAPLLGKHTGTYWWNDCVLGSEDVGVRVKDYTVRH